jgi:hypothetical protein
MEEFNYTFINAERDEIAYTQMHNNTFTKDYGARWYDNDDYYCGYHSTLVCKHKGVIIGGISAYLSDQKRTDPLPMEKRGIHLKKYIDLKNIRYAEICRAAVLKEFRKYHIYSELVKKCTAFCVRIGCKYGFWVAKKHHTTFYKNELELIGIEAKSLDRIKYTLNHDGKDPVVVDYYLSYCCFQDQK